MSDASQSPTGTLDLKKTVHLPKTEFSMKANLSQMEPRMLARWDETGLYRRIREAAKAARGPLADRVACRRGSR